MDPAVAAAFAAQFQPQPPPFAVVSSADVHPVSVAHAAPNLAQPVPSHPSYQEMITAAILWDNSQGKEGGSSKRAIEKYIARVYSNLPPTHSALLTHHIKRLKTSGQLVMIKNSYQLPTFAPPSPVRSAPPPPPPQPPQQQQQQFLQPPPPPPPPPAAPEISPSPTPKRRPGRPPKQRQVEPEPEPEVVEFQRHQPVSAPNASPVAVNGGSLGKRPRGRPPRSQNQSQSQTQQQVVVPFVQPVSEVVKVQKQEQVSNGQVEGSAPKRRGRPPRKQQEPVFQVEVEKVVPEVVHPQVNGVEVVKRRPGRPPKANVGVGVGRGRGRPRKNNVVNVNMLAPVSGAVGKKQRGWPRGKPRGKKVGAGGLRVPAANVAAAIAGGKRRGRKPKGSGLVAGLAAKMYTGKPRGRPRKNSILVKHNSQEGPDMSNEDLRRKLEDMQSKIRDAVEAIRPHVADQNSAGAFSALQQLEDLSTMNITASAALIEPPVMAMPINVAAAPPSTSVPESLADAVQSLTGPTIMAFTAPSEMSVPLAYSMNLPSVTVTAPLHAPSSIENHQPLGWIPSSEAQS